MSAGVKLASGYIDLDVKYGGSMKKITSDILGLKATAGRAGKDAGTAFGENFTSSAQRSMGHGVKVDVDTRQANTKIRSLKTDLRGLRSFGLINIGVAGVASLPALATGLAEVAAAIQQVSQAALALPGGIAGAVSSIGTLVFGLTGVSDAYDAMNKAADESAKSGQQVASQARAQQSASFSLRNAIIDEAEAREDVNRAMVDAVRHHEDLSLQMRGGVNDEKRAVLELEKARARLVTGDYSSYQEALLDVSDAELRVDEVRERNKRTAEELAEANEKGVAGNNQVVAANERLTRSIQGVAQAEAAVAAAVPGATAAQENAALAMSKLAPNAQEFVKTMMDLQGPIMSLRNLVQNNIFAGLSGQLLGFTDKAMPTLEKALGGMGTAWNRTFTEMFNVLGKDENLGILERIFGNTETAQNIMTTAINPLVTGLGTLTEAGTRALPRLATGFVNLTQRFSDFITKADESGKLDVWIDEGITALSNLGEIALNFGKMVTAVSEAADGDLLANLVEWTDGWQTWLNSAEGQQTLTKIFDEGKRIWEQWKPILEDVPGIFEGIYNAAKTYIGGLLTIISPVTEVLGRFPGIVETAAMAFLIFKGAKVLGSFGPVLTMLGTTLPGEANKTALAIEGAGDKAGKGFAAKFDGAMKAFGWAAIGLYISGEIEKGFDSLFGTKTAEIGMPGTLKWFVNLAKDPGGTLKATLGNLFGGQSAPSANGVLPGAPGQVNGQTPTVGGIPIPGLLPGSATGQSAGTTYGLPAGSSISYGAEGFPDWVYQIGKAFGVEASTYGGHQEGSGQNRGIDWRPVGLDVGSAEGAAVMQRFAEYLATVPGMEQVIWQNPVSGARVGRDPGDRGANQTIDDYYADDWAGHQDHVHSRQSTPIPLPWQVWGQVPGRANGGVAGVTGAGKIFGPGSGTSDSILGINALGVPTAFVSDGEGVVRKNAMDRGGAGLVAALNAGWLPSADYLHAMLPGFAQGGVAAAGRNLAGLPWDEERLRQMQENGVTPGGVGFQESRSAAALAGAPTAATDPKQRDPYQLDAFGDAARTEGYIPAGASNSSVAGTSFLSGLYGMGADVVKGVIDQAASAASTAVAAGIAGGSMGAGAAGGAQAGAAAAQFAIGMGTQAIKRGVDWGAQMLGIGTDSLIEIFSPFGTPRWVSTDPTAFLPQGLMSAATTSIEKAFQSQKQSGLIGDHQAAGTPPGPVQPGQVPGAQTVGPSAPSANPGGVRTAAANLGPAVTGSATGNGQSSAQAAALGLDEMRLRMGVYDSGGVLPPNGLALNLSKQPELVLNNRQWTDGMATMAAVANSQPSELDPAAIGGGNTNDYRIIFENVTVKDVDELERKATARQKLQIMRNTGRPSSG